VVEFFDLLYLGIFVILSSAFDVRFYSGQKPSMYLVKEIFHAVDEFYNVLGFFSEEFIVVVGGEPVNHLYVLDRMLAEFAAASVLLAKGIDGLNPKESSDESEHRIVNSTFFAHIEGILQKSHPEVVPYYSRCLARGHKDFLWTGPNVHIMPRSVGTASLTTHARKGELQELPSHRIYTEDLDRNPPIVMDRKSEVGKRRGSSSNLEDEQAKKRSRQS
jgi:hypothetical protein